MSYPRKPRLTKSESDELVGARRKWAAEWAPDALVFDGYDSAIVGVAERCGQPPLIVYDHALIMRALVAKGASPEAAVEWIGYNIVGAWAGEHTPLVLHRPAPEDLE